MKQKSPLLPRNLALMTSSELLIMLSTKVNLLYLLFKRLEVLSSAYDKAKLFAENFSLNSNLDDSGVSWPVFPSRTNLKLHNISVTPKMVRKVVMNLDLSKASGPDCIPVVVIKNCEPGLSYILAELFNTNSIRQIKLLDFGVYLCNSVVEDSLLQERGKPVLWW